MHTEAVQVAGTYEGPGNKLPEITTDEIVLNENAGDAQTAEGTSIGKVVATDADNEDASLKYGIEPVSSQFGIGTSDGQITLKAAVNFNYEGGPREYTLTVKVEDPEGGNVKGEVKVSIADINEAPELGEIGSRRAIIGHEFEMTFAPVTDEDTGQSHTYSASLADGGDLPTWLVFAGSDRKFTIGSGASGITAATYQISVDVADSGTPPLSASRVFALTVVEAGRIESSLLPVFSRAGPEQELSVRLSVRPDKEVTVTLSMSDGSVASVAPLKVVFDGNDWNSWKVAQVSISSETQERKDGIAFAVTVLVHDAETGDELYMHTEAVQVAGAYEGPGNKLPEITTDEIVINENAGDARTTEGTRIGKVAATDADNEDASLKYVLEPVSSQFGIGTSDGQISLKVDTNFDYEGGPREYTLTVKVEDPEGGSVKGEVKVSIADINEAPEFGEIGSRRAIIGHEFEMTFAPATDEDTGQSHTYSASLADGGDLPTWLVFAGSDRKFTIGSGASGITAATYQISVSAIDDGSPQLSASQVFALTVVEAGRIESTLLPVFNRAGPEQELSVRLSAKPVKKVTVTLSMSDGSVASVVPQKVVFDGNDWNSWKVAQVSISSETQESKYDVSFVVTASVHNAEDGDELYIHTDAAEVVGRYKGPGNKPPKILVKRKTEILDLNMIVVTIKIRENAGTMESQAGTAIGEPLQVSDEDDQNGSWIYSFNPTSELFGIDSREGKITLKKAVNFNYEKGPREYRLTVKVDDEEGGIVNGEVRIEIEDINEAPELGEIGSRRAIIGHEFEMEFDPATDEDAGQSHTYSASLADGEDLPTWLVFAGSDRKFTIGSGASGITAVTYQISVDVADSGTPPLSASQIFALTVVEAGRIESTLLPVFSRAGPEQELSVRLSVRPDKEVTVTLRMSDGSVASVAPLKVVFDGNDWNSWKVAQVSISSETQERKDGIAFAVTVSVHDAENGDELYMHTEAVQVAGTYEGPGNKLPEITTDEIVINENAGDARTTEGTRIGKVAAIDADNEDASLKYGLEPVSSQFGIGTSDGQVTLKAAVNFNYEGGPREYTLTVKVEDPDGGSVKGEVKVSIADINEAPELGEIGSRRAIIGHEFEMTFAPATDEDTGQSHTYSASLTDGGDLPTWLVFAGSDRKFTIGSGASGITAATYQISVSVTDDGTLPLSASRVFALTVVEAGRIESTLLPAFSRAGPEQELSVRLSAKPVKKVTVTLRMSDGSVASVAPQKVVFDGNDWNSWKVAQVSISSETQERKDGIAFAVTVSVHDAETGDELYMHTEAVQVAGTYEGPGNKSPEITTDEIVLNENAGDARTTEGTRIGKVAATDADNEDASLKYGIEPVSSQFGIGTSDGQISLKVDTNFDYEGGPREYTLTVKVEDPEGGRVKGEVKISIADINEVPEFGEIGSRRAIIGHGFEMTFAPVTDEDTGQSHTYSASLADGGDLPTWLVFAGSDRKFTIGSDASGITAATYQISVDVADSGTPPLSASRVFALTVVEAGRIESTLLPVFSRAGPEQELSVRLSVRPDKEVTVTLSMSDGSVASVAPLKVVFDGNDWNSWKVAQVSISSETQERKDGIAFAVTVSVHDAENGDELYMHTEAVQVAGTYEGPGNKLPEITTDEIVINENAGDARTTEGTRIGKVAATDADNEDASLKYGLEPVSSQFGIGTSDGQVTLKAAVNFNYEGGPREYTLTVKVEDPDGGSVKGEVKVSIADINEAPELGEIGSRRAIIGHEFEMTFAPATDEDTGQSHTYSASLTDGGDLPTWLVFAGSDRKFTIGSGASRITAATYQISVSVTDDGTLPLSASRVFALTVVEAGRIESTLLPAFSRAGPEQELSVRLSAKPVKKVTVTLRMSDGSVASVAPLKVVFDGNDWNSWKVAQVSISSETQERKDGIAFAVTVSVHDAETGDELYMHTEAVQVAGTYEGPGNKSPEITTDEIVLNENAGDARTTEGTRIGKVAATDADNEDASLKYGIEPVSSQFGIGTSDGQISLKVDTNFDYEGGPREYTLTVKVEDPEGGRVKGEVKISIADINEAPELGEIGSRRAIIGHEFEMTFAPATDEDTGQSHTYSASLTDGGDLPTWLVFAGSDRKFTIGSGASGITAATYQISVSVTDDGTLPLSASRVFALTVVEAGRIESTLLPAFSRAGPEQELSVRLSAKPVKKVTVTLRMSDGSVASVAPLKVVFDGNDWNSWKVAQVSISSETQERKDGIAFAVTVSVHDAETGDELYMHTEAVQVAGTYEGPGNKSPEITTDEIVLNENAGDARTTEGTRIGKVAATDADNEDASLKYGIEPVSSQFGIGTSDGQISLKVDTNFDYEGGPREYTLTVKVEDPEGGSVKGEVKVSIADINEVPELGEIGSRRAIIGHEFEMTFAPATDEDTGQSHTYSASLADGGDLPTWLVFAGSDRKFTIGSGASGITAATYQISVSVTDDGSPAS